MRRVLTGWIIVALGFTALGLGAVIGAQMARVPPMPADRVQEWLQYAQDVEHGTRTPSAAITRLLTETALAQQEYARSAVDLLRLVGAGVALLGIFLTVDLIRHRARHDQAPRPGS